MFDELFLLTRKLRSLIDGVRRFYFFFSLQYVDEAMLRILETMTLRERQEAGLEVDEIKMLCSGQDG